MHAWSTARLFMADKMHKGALHLQALQIVGSCFSGSALCAEEMNGQWIRCLLPLKGVISFELPVSLILASGLIL